MAAIGTVQPPSALDNFSGDPNVAIGQLLNVIFYAMVTFAGIYALFNFIIAGYTFLSAGDDPKAIQSAWAKIYQSIIGLLFAAGAFILAAIIGLLIFGDATAILTPQIQTVGP